MLYCQAVKGAFILHFITVVVILNYPYFTGVLEPLASENLAIIQTRKIYRYNWNYSITNNNLNKYLIISKRIVRTIIINILNCI